MHVCKCACEHLGMLEFAELNRYKFVSANPIRLIKKLQIKRIKCAHA